MACLEMHSLFYIYLFKLHYYKFQSATQSTYTRIFQIPQCHSLKLEGSLSKPRWLTDTEQSRKCSLMWESSQHPLLHKHAPILCSVAMPWLAMDYQRQFRLHLDQTLCRNMPHGQKQSGVNENVQWCKKHSVIYQHDLP